MFTRFKTILCHPSRLGMYLLDKWRMVFGFLAAFFLVAVGLILVVDLNASAFTYDDAKEISNQLIMNEQLDNAGYDGKKLYGTATKISTSSIIIYFNETAYKTSVTSSSLILVMGDDSANVYFGTLHLSEYSYKNDLTPWDISDINDGDVSARVALTDFIYNIVQTANKKYRSVLIADDIFSTIMYWAIAFISCMVVAFFVNPFIERKFRVKISMYASLSFFMGIWFDVLYSQPYFLYGALILPVIYTFIALSRIRKIEVKRRDSNDHNRSN